MEKINFRRFNFFNLIYTLGVILWGAYVRATGSGAGCGAHWPLCNGEVIPVSNKLQTLIEFTHRASSGVSLILVGIGFLWSRKVARAGSPIRKAASFTAIAIVLEALLGAGLVLLRLVEFDQSAARAVSISLHLVNTLFLIATLSSLWFLSREPRNYEPSHFKLFPKDPFFGVTLLVFVCLGISGAVTALGDTLFPASSLAHGLNQDFESGSHFLVKLRVIHPVLAVTWILIVFQWSRKLETLELKGIRGTLLGFVTLQFTIGFLNWILMAPNFLQLIHLLVADLVFISFWISGIKHETRESPLQA